MGELAAQVRDITGGTGARVILDGVGKASWEASIGSIARRGLMVSYGNASGAVPPFDPLLLSRSGSIFVTRPTLFDYIATRDERIALAARVFDMMESGRLAVPIGQTFGLNEAAEAHRALESRSTTGATLLLP
jgi:NADPH:quinone reductase